MTTNRKEAFDTVAGVTRDFPEDQHQGQPADPHEKPDRPADPPQKRPMRVAAPDKKVLRARATHAEEAAASLRQTIATFQDDRVRFEEAERAASEAFEAARRAHNMDDMAKHAMRRNAIRQVIEDTDRDVEELHSQLEAANRDVALARNAVELGELAEAANALHPRFAQLLLDVEAALREYQRIGKRAFECGMRRRDMGDHSLPFTFDGAVQLENRGLTRGIKHARERFDLEGLGHHFDAAPAATKA